MIRTALLLCLALAACAPVPTSTPDEEGEEIRLWQGKIEKGSSAPFQKATKRGSTIAVNTGGGHVGEAYQMATHIKRRNVQVIVPPGAVCLSACVLLLLADDQPVISREARVGVHRPVYPNYVESKAVIDRMSEMVRRLGGRSSLVDLMWATPNDSMDFLTEAEISHHFNAIFLP